MSVEEKCLITLIPSNLCLRALTEIDLKGKGGSPLKGSIRIRYTGLPDIDYILVGVNNKDQIRRDYRIGFSNVDPLERLNFSEFCH
jgi:hypothetical protein